MDCSHPSTWAPSVHGISQAEYWSGLPFPPPGDLPDSRTELTSPEAPTLAGGFFTTESPGKPVRSLDKIKSLIHPVT